MSAARRIAAVSADLGSQYTLGYYVPASGAKGSFRHLRVECTDPALAARYTLRYRNAYSAFPGP